MQNFRALGAPPPDLRVSGGWGLPPKPPASGGWGLRPQTPIDYFPQNSPPLRISGYATVICYLYMLLLSLARL